MKLNHLEKAKINHDVIRKYTNEIFKEIPEIFECSKDIYCHACVRFNSDKYSYPSSFEIYFNNLTFFEKFSEEQIKERFTEMLKKYGAEDIQFDITADNYKSSRVYFEISRDEYKKRLKTELMKEVYEKLEAI